MKKLNWAADEVLRRIAYVALGILLISGFVMSAPHLTEVARNHGVTHTPYLLPVLYDAGMLVFSFLIMTFAARGMSYRWEMWFKVLLAAFGITINTVDEWLPAAKGDSSWWAVDYVECALFGSLQVIMVFATISLSKLFLDDRARSGVADRFRQMETAAERLSDVRREVEEGERELKQIQLRIRDLSEAKALVEFYEHSARLGERAEEVFNKKRGYGREDKLKLIQEAADLVVARGGPVKKEDIGRVLGRPKQTLHQYWNEIKLN